MRDRKYRFWDGNNMFSLDGSMPDLIITFDGKVMVEYEDYHGRHICKEVEGTLLEYTGLKDKNGKEIYEGDVLKTTHNNGFDEETGPIYYNKTGVVEWPDGYQFGYRLRWKKGHMMIKNSSQISNSMNGEIIGNIYENPELLKEE